MRLHKQQPLYPSQGSAVWHVLDCRGLLLGVSRPGVPLYKNCPREDAAGWMFDVWWNGAEYARAHAAHRQLQEQVFATRREALQVLSAILPLLDAQPSTFSV